MKLMSPITRSAPQNPTGARMELSNFSEIKGAIHITPKTPSLAIAISSPMARAISLPLNHLARILDTLVPSISHPHPKIMNPSEAILALPGNSTHQLSSHPQKAVLWNQSLTAMNFIPAPKTISPAERIPENRTPSLSRMIPARIRNPQTLRMYSDAAYFPNTPLSHPSLLSTRDLRGDITSTNI